MYKPIYNNWAFNEPTIRVINRGSNGLVKEAKWYIEYKSTPGYTYVNALFLGAGEAYSSNLNGDYFYEDDLINKHNTFLNGHHFKHHENDDPEKSYGTVEGSFYNPEMRRVEGIIKIINEKSPTMIERINRGEPIPLSMACRVKYDICSICGHKSHNIKEYCDHLKYQMCDILPDGRKVYAINPDPVFFDISEVIKGADPTAFTLRKVASANKEIFMDKISVLDKISLLESLAAIEKRILGMIEKKDPKVELLSRGIDETCKVKEGNLQVLAKSGVLIRPNDFDMSGKCSMYNDLLAYKDKNNMLEKINFFDNLGNIDYNIIEKRSLLNPYIHDRILYGNTKVIPTSKNYIDKSSSIKMAAINLAIIYNNQDLRDNKLGIESSIVQNCLL